MDLEAQAAAAAAFMEQLGAGALEHPGGTLLAHLRRVRERLAGWGADAGLQLAGLCHAAYGTDGFRTALLATTERYQLSAIIGARAEDIVYFYAGCDREKSYPAFAAGGPVIDRFSGQEMRTSKQRRREFAELTAANELDIVAVSAEFREQWGGRIRELLRGFRPLLSEPALRDCAELLPE